MCFWGGGGGSPSYEPSPAPTPAPAPVAAPMPSTIEPTAVAAQTAEQRRKRVAAVKAGMMSTIKTGPAGMTGVGPDLSAVDTGKKTKLGS